MQPDQPGGKAASLPKSPGPPPSTPSSSPRLVLLKTFIMTRCESYMTVSYHKLVGLPKVRTVAGSPGAGASLPYNRLISCLGETFGIWHFGRDGGTEDR